MMPSAHKTRRRIACGTLLLLTSVASAGAQARPVPPDAPTGTVQDDPRDAGYPAWRDANLTLAAESRHIGSGRYEAIVRSPGARERARRFSDIDQVIDRCVERFRLSEQQASALKARNPWAAFDSLTNGPYIAVTILPSIADPVDCGHSPGEQNEMRERALRFGTEPLAPSANEVRSVEVRRGSTVITPVMIGRTEVTKVVTYVRPMAPGPVAPDGSHAVRIYLRYDDLAPTSGADTTGIEFRIWNGVDTIPWSLHVPRATVNSLWREIIAWRLERSRTTGAQGLPIGLPAANNPAYAPARSAYDNGDYVGGALSAVSLLDRNVLPASDRLTAMVQVGVTLRALGDGPAAAHVIADALELEPCLGFPETAPAEFRELADDLRPPSRCNMKSMGEIIRLGLVPGRAQRSLQPVRYVGGNAVTGFTIALGIVSVATHVKAQSLHREYVGETVDPIAAYRDAERMRANATMIGLAAYAVWGGAIVHAVFAERAHHRTLDSVRYFGGTDQRSVRVAPAPRGFGLALHFF